MYYNKPLYFLILDKEEVKKTERHWNSGQMVFIIFEEVNTDATSEERRVTESSDSILSTRFWTNLLVILYIMLVFQIIRKN